jgi:hypothetical protein
MYPPGRAPVPRNGGLGYGMHARRALLAPENKLRHNGINARLVLDDTDGIAAYSSRRRWRVQENGEGDVIPKQHTGNKRSEKSIIGVPLVLLALYRILYPKAHRCEIQAFLFRAHSGVGNNPFFYSLTAITDAEAALGLNRKKGSTTAYQAFTPINLLRRTIYWRFPGPFGIRDVKREDMIDFDQAGLSVTKGNRSHGKCHVTSRVSAAGNYGHDVNWTLMMAIAGNQTGDRWYDFYERRGTTVMDVYDFILRI